MLITSIWGALILVMPSQAGGVLLRDDLATDQCYEIRQELSLTGEIRVIQDAKMVPLKLVARAEHVYAERILAGGPPAEALKAARNYSTAKATISVEGNPGDRTLRDDHRLIILQRIKDQTSHYAPAGALRREELELVAEHLDSLALAGIMPGKSMAVESTWDVPPSVVQALGHFEGLAEHAVKARLVSIVGDKATIQVSGRATGIEIGATVRVEFDASLTYDVAAGRVVAARWRQKDEREAGPASPAVTVDATIMIQRKLIPTPTVLGDPALVSVPKGFEPSDVQLAIDYKDDKGRFELLHARDWHMVAKANSHLVLRLMDKGDFLAQATLSQWTKAENGKPMSPEAFKEAMGRIPGWEPAKELQGGEVPSGDKRYIYRWSVVGKMEGVDVMQNFYLVAWPDGNQMVVTVTTAPKQAERLGSRDLALVGSLDREAKAGE